MQYSVDLCHSKLAGYSPTPPPPPPPPPPASAKLLEHYFFLNKVHSTFQIIRQRLIELERKHARALRKLQVDLNLLLSLK